MAPQSILIVLMGSIGDLVRGLAIAAPLRKSFPQARLTWLVEPACSPLVRDHPLIDEVLVFDRAHPASGVLNLRRELRARRFDVTLDLQRHFKSGFFSWLSRAPRRIGFHRSNAKECNWIFQTEFIAAAAESLPKLQHYLMFLRPLGAAAEGRPYFGIAEREVPEQAGQLLREVSAPFVVMVLGSSWHSKDWLLEGYQKLISYLLEHPHYHIVLCGDKSQAARAQEIMQGHADGRVVNLVGRTSLLDLGYILRKASACVGPDSGPAHIAAAVGTAHVTLFGPTSPARVAPYGSEHLSLQSAVGCAPCYRKRCPGLDRLCMRLLSAEAVWEQLQTALARQPGAQHI